MKLSGMGWRCYEEMECPAGVSFSLEDSLFSGITNLAHLITNYLST